MVKYDNGDKIRLSGVYKITNLATKYVYIGESIDVVKRFQEHNNGILYNNSYNYQMKHDSLIYGLGSFKYELIYLLNEEDLPISSYDYKINYLLYLENAIYRMLEKKGCKFYNLKPTYDSIKKRYINIPTYNVNYELIEDMLTSNPANINYDTDYFVKYFSSQDGYDIDDVLKNVDNVQIDLNFYRYMPTFQGRSMFDLYFSYNNLTDLSSKHKDKCCYILEKLDKIKTTRGKNSGKTKIYYIENLTDEPNYIQQDVSANRKIDKGRIRKDRPLLLSHNAIFDIATFLSQEDIVNSIKNEYEIRKAKKLNL